MNWAAAEFESIDLGDSRRNRRAIHFVERLSANSTASIPQACGDWADTIAAYRFFGNDEVQWADILAPHIESSTARMAAHQVVPYVQDTTELDFNGQEANGLGPLCDECQRGMYVHPTFAVSTSREPLGVLEAWMWAREPCDTDSKRSGVSESLRWIAGYEHLAEMAAQVSQTRLMYLADRKADIMAVMVRARDLGQPVDWLLRSKHNRTLSEGEKLWSRVTQGESWGEIRFTLASRQAQRAREVVQNVWAQTLQLPVGKDGFVRATCIVARELDPADGDTPIEWRLLTNLDLASLDQAAQMIEWYRARWEIEMFFHFLKNGCCIEALQLGSIEKIERALVLYMTVGWRIARLIRQGRSCPDLDAQLMFEPDEWRADYILNKLKIPTTPSRLNEVTCLVAKLDGFLAVMGCPASRPSGWVCGASLTSPMGSGSHASFRGLGLVYNEMR